MTGEIHSFKNFGNTQTGNSLSVTNANTSLVPLNPNVATGVTVTTSSSARTVTGSVGSNLITSGKSVTTLEAPKNPVVKPFIKPKQDIETVKQPAVTSEKPKTVERSHSQGSNNHNSNKESFNQKTEKNSNRNSAGENFVEKSGGINQEKTFRTGGAAAINAGTFENSVTLGNAVPLKNGEEKIVVYLNKKTSKGKRHYYGNINYLRSLYDGGVGYESGQPSIIEGQQVIVSAPNIIQNPIEAGNGKVLNNGGATGRALISSTSVGMNKGTSSANGQVQAAGNTLLSKLNSSFGGNSQVNGSTNLNNPVNNGFDRAIQIAGNNSGIKDIKNTGRIDVNPILSSAMFTTNMNPSSKYLLETRSRYISLGQYFGSDYFTSRVGYSEIWDRTRRLGDAYYENQLLTRALAEKLGTAFINGKSNQELVKSMIDNAATEGTRLGLTVGQELTQDQINSLNEDIVWYVTKNVNGVEVLAPQVYLSSKTRESISDDTRNRVGGINGTYVKTKDFVNDGTKWGNGGVTYVEANTVRNETTNNLLSEISGDRTFISSVGNIENIGGRINGEEAVALISEKGNVINNTTKRTTGFNYGEYDKSQREEIASIGGITSKGTTFIKADSYNSVGGMLKTDHLALDVNSFNASALSLSGQSTLGISGSNYSKYAETTHFGGGAVANSAEGRIGNLNLRGSSFIAEDTTGLAVGNVRAESAINTYDIESRQSNKSTFASSSNYVKSHQEENVASNLQLGKNAVITGNVEGIGSNIVLGENTFVGGKVTTDSRELHNSYYEKNKNKGFTGGVSHGTISAGYGKSQSTYDEKSTINAKSNLQVGDGSVLNRGAEITATNFEYGNIQINNGDVKYGARIDTRDVHTSSKSSGFTISAGINSPIKDRIKQAAGAVSQVKNGDAAGGAMEAVNAATGTINGLSENITRRDGTRATMNDIEKGDFKVNNDFYVSGNIRAGFNKSKSSTASHIESAAVTTMKPLNENSSITYNNVNNITYQGTQAQGGTFIYNNVANIQKEAVELRNRYSSESSGFGVGVSAGIGSNGQIKPNGISGNVSANRSNQNTVETVYANGNFKNVNEVHNNTGSMTLSGFNQEGGKVTGNIGKLVVESRQNTSTTTGRSSGIGLGISANGMPSSVNVSGSRTNGNRAFVDNQSSFIVGEGSNLHVGTLENTGAVIGKQSENSTTFKIDNYIAKNIYNEDTMTTTGGSIGASLGGKPRITSAGFNQDSRDKEGITRNTVVGNVEIQNASGDEINRDLSKANEVTKDTHSSTNINVEPQVIEYISNPTKFKEDLEVAILEGKATGETVLKSIENAVNGRRSSDIGDPERRTINEIKESVIRIKTAPEMNLIATGDLNSEKILKELDISAVEKYDPDNPNLPPKVRARVDKLAQKGEVPGIFYDKITNKIFVDENITDEAVIRAGIAREWKISEDLKTGKGKANDEGQLKSTVAGELAYDDMMKRAREGKTGSISTSELDEAVMDTNSEVSADDLETRRLSNAGISPKTVRINEERRRRRREEFNSVGYIRQQIDKEEKKHVNSVANSLERKYRGKFTKKNGTYAFYNANDRKKFEKEANQKGVHLKTSYKNLYKNGNPENLTELKTYYEGTGKLPKNTEIILQDENGKQRVYKSFDEFIYGTPEERKLEQSYSNKINENERKLNLAKKNHNTAEIKRLEQESVTLHREQAAIYSSRNSRMGEITQKGDLILSAKSYKNGKLIIHSEKYYHQLNSEEIAIGLELMDHSAKMEEFYKPDVTNVGQRESRVGIRRDNANNPSVTEGITNRRLKVKPVRREKGENPKHYYTKRAAADKLSYESQRIAETRNNFKLPSELRYHEEPEIGGTTVIGAGQSPKRGAYNIDYSPTPEIGVFFGDANNLTNIPSNSQAKVISENPYNYSPFNSEINRIIQPGGVLKTTGMESNKFFYQEYEKIFNNLEIPNGYTEILKIGEIPENLRIQGFQGVGGRGKRIQKPTNLEIKLVK
ncbi:hemagglutinin repeat-containing protein [Leptotrichia wadei]|uniref:Putative septum site-determining protein MinC n=1 Tax=Leptotrichia wadei TaxID=157687 RepID=A0A510KH59_9FUSO|nr:hemagglutinin repeat-containing protein [Leptotrichia wadei]BBM51016.1 putative septum site-determining protein MinC [Leptotrichia wadei]